jgi:hypothetical protein
MRKTLTTGIILVYNRVILTKNGETYEKSFVIIMDGILNELVLKS